MDFLRLLQSSAAEIDPGFRVATRLANQLGHRVLQGDRGLKARPLDELGDVRTTAAGLVEADARGRIAARRRRGLDPDDVERQDRDDLVVLGRDELGQ